MFCCVRTRGRAEGSKYDNQPTSVVGQPSHPAPPPSAAAVPHGYDVRNDKPAGGGIKDGNMVILAGAGVGVAAAGVATAAVVTADESGQGNKDAGRGGGAASGGGVAAVDGDSGGGTSQGCCCGGCGGDGGDGGGCGGCGGCGG